MTRAVLVVSFAVLLLFLGTAASGERSGETVRSQLAGQPVRLSLPAQDDPKGLVIWFHGQGGNVNDRVDGPWLDALRRDGWAIASSNFHDQSWGNPASTKDLELLLNWAGNLADVPVKLWVSGSMGASVALNGMIHGAEAPPCWYGVKPAIALTEMGTVPGGPGFIYRAYGGAVPVDRDPVRNIDRLPTQTRYRVVSSVNDEWVNYAKNTVPLVDGLVGRGAEISRLTVDGPHMDPSHLNARDLVDFAATCA